MSELRIAVMSDIHAGERESNWTHVVAEPPVARRGQQPLSDLARLVEDSGLKADYLVVPGDIANQADAVGLAYGWRKAHAVAEQLEARLVAAPGNHDVVTRAASADPRYLLKNLLPTFPTGDATADAHFWERGWCLIEREDHRILLLDSTVDFPEFPIGAVEGDDDWKTYIAAIDRGGFPEDVEEELDSRFRNCSEKLNLAVLHHHPQEHQLRTYLQDGYGAMRRGGDLLDLLSRHAQMGRWIVVHGHKHIPQLVNAVGATSNGPLVLCAASLGAKIWDPVNTVARNQFHLITASAADSSTTGSLMGAVESYTWGYGEGWQLSERRGSGLPGNSGFGCAEDFRTVGAHIERVMEGEELQFIPYSDLVEAVPQLPYLLPRDWDFLEDHLEVRGYAFTRNRQQRIVQLARMAVI